MIEDLEGEIEKFVVSFVVICRLVRLNNECLKKIKIWKDLIKNKGCLVF